MKIKSSSAIPGWLMISIPEKRLASDGPLRTLLPEKRRQEIVFLGVNHAIFLGTQSAWPRTWPVKS